MHRGATSPNPRGLARMPGKNPNQLRIMNTAMSGRLVEAALIMLALASAIILAALQSGPLF